MKKITLLLIFIAFFTNNLLIQSQIINEPANWPNANWTINGVFSASGFAQDPRVSANFSWDDDAAGSGSLFDDIAAESPVINLVSAIPAEQQIQVTVDYVYRRVGDVLTLEWWDLSTGLWMPWQQFSNNSNNLDFKSCTGMQTFVSQPLIIATFTTTQLLGFKYRIRYNDNGFDWGMCFESPTLISLETPPCLDVSNITIDADDITDSSAIISWTDNNGVPPNNGWEIEYGETGFVQGAGTTVIALLNPYTLTSLLSSTTYDVYIRALCTDDEQSGWVGPVSFTTEQSFDVCGQFVDSGGPNGQYDNNEDTTTTFFPDVAGNVVTVNFLSFNTESCCDDLTIYDGDTIGATVLGVFAGTDLPPTFTSTHATGALTFRFESDGSVVRDGWVANIICGLPPTCFAPTNIVVANIEEDNVDISWTDNNTPDPVGGWEVEVVESGTAPTEIGTITFVTNLNVTGLSASTSYDVFVRAICDENDETDQSFWVGASFSTPIAPPACDGVYVDSGGPDGNYSNGETIEYVICPDNAGDVVTLQFLEFNTENNWDGIAIFNGPSTGSPIFDSGYINPGFGTTPNGGWTGNTDFVPTILTSTDASGCITVVFTSDGSVTRSGWIANVLCSPPPTCFIPVNLNVTNVTFDAAILSWTETTTPTPATNWNVEIVPAGTEPTGVGMPVTDNPYTATGLTPETSYDYYVQADCGNGDTSFWAGPFNFVTPASCIVVSNVNFTNVNFNSGQVNWTDTNPVLPIGGWDVEYSFSGFVQGTGTLVNVATPPTLYDMTGLTPSTDYDVYIRVNCATDDSDSSLWVGPFSFRTDDVPPPNDTCITAIPLNVTVACEPIIGNNVLATESSLLEGEVLPSTCDSYINNALVLDVWYLVEVPVSGNLYMETARINGGMVDSVLAVYSGECGNLVELDCQDDSVVTDEDDPESAFFSSIFLRDRTPGEILYIRVWSLPEFISDGDVQPNIQGAFTICVLGQSRAYQSPLGIQDELNDFKLSYYPNPVDAILNVTSDKEIDQIVVYNLLGQEILNKSFNNVSNVILNTENFTHGTYVVKVSSEGSIKTFKFIKK